MLSEFGFIRMMRTGPPCGYFPEPVNCVVVVKEGFEEKAMELFLEFDAKIVSASKNVGKFY